MLNNKGLNTDPWGTPVYGNSFTTFAHNFSSLTPIAQKVNDQITRMFIYAICR